MMTWASRIGLDVPAFSLRSAESIEGVPKAYKETTAFVIDRYDRGANGRIHQEDFAQVQNLAREGKYEGSYETLGRLVQALAAADSVEFLRRLAFVIGSGNGDAHWKNWSLLYRDGRSASLAPVYDQVSTVAWPELERKLALSLGSERAFGDITARSIEKFANKAGFPGEQAMETTAEVFASMAHVWKHEHQDWPLLDGHADAIRQHWQRTPLLRDTAILS